MAARPSITSVCRVLPNPDDVFGGVFVLRRLEAMAAQSEFNLLHPIPYFPGVRPLPRWARTRTRQEHGIEVIHAPMLYVPKVLKSLDGLWLCRAVLGKLNALRKERGVQIVDAHFAYPDGVGCVRAAKRLGMPVFITVRGVEVDYLRTPLIREQVRRALAGANGCITVSHSLKKLIVDGGVPGENIRVIHNAVDRGVFRVMDRMIARRKLEIDSSDSLIVSVGNLLSVKGHDTLIDAFAELLVHEPRARLVIIGGPMHEPDSPGKLRMLCEELRVRDRVVFVGKVPPSEVARWLNAADVFALASKREGCCNAVLEALACGVPVVTTPAGDNPWFVHSGENGFIVSVGDSRAMAQALLDTLKSKHWERDRISAELQVGDWSSVAGQVIEFFSDRLEAGRRGTEFCESSA